MSLSKYSKKVWIPDVVPEFDFVTKFYGPDLNVHALEMQLQIFATNFIMEGKKTSIKDILKHLRNICSAQRALLSEICIIAKLILVMPATNAVSERPGGDFHMKSTWGCATS